MTFLLVVFFTLEESSQYSCFQQLWLDSKVVTAFDIVPHNILEAKVFLGWISIRSSVLGIVWMARPEELWSMELNPVDGRSRAVSPWAWYWGHFSLTSVLMILMSGLSAPSVSLQTPPSWEGVLICLKGEGHCSGTWIDWMDGPRQTV